MQLNNLFNPRSVAVIGASSDKNKVGYALMANLLYESTEEKSSSKIAEIIKSLTSNKKRVIYPVSISEKEILGLKTYNSIKEIDAEIDLAVIAVRADVVPSILEECASKNIKTVIIISAGFKEIGHEGLELEKKVAEIAKKNGITMLGPNCLGAIDVHTNMNASFASSHPKKGHIAFLSQSGALGTAVLDKALAEGIGFSKFISLGNEASLTEIEFMEFLRDDKDTEAILMYVEQLTDGHRFMELAEEITKNKPIVLIKAGKGERGQQAVMSHTGSLAPEDAVFSAACRQSGIIVVQSIREFFNMAKLLELRIFKPLQKMIVLTNAGGPAVVASDLIESSHSLSLVEFSEETISKLKKSLPPMAAFNNPVDIIGDALSDRYETALKILVEEKEADAIIVIVTPQMMTEAEKTAELIVKYNEKKTIIPVFIGGANLDIGLEVLQKNNLINFTFPKDAVEALDDMACNALKIEVPKIARKLGAGSLEKKERMMSFGDTCKLFNNFGLSVSGILIKDKSELKDTMSKLGGDRFILKIMSPDVVHKTEMGAVKLNIKSTEEAEKAWDEMLASVKNKKMDAVIEGVLVQAMSSGKEIIIGMKKDPIFGPTVLFGLGGIFTEALKDTSLRIAPISKDVAQKMIHEIHGINILTGLRGEKPIDFEAIADVIVKISKLSIEHPEIVEIDLNPVMVRSDGAEVVDARVMVEV